MFEALQIGPFIFWTHLLALLFGIWLATEFFLRLASSANLPIAHFKESARWYILSFLLGGRLIAIITEYRVYLKDPLRSFIFWDGNFSFLGAAIGVAGVLFVLTRQHRSTFLQWLDALVPATTLGLTFAWLGKFTAGIAYGKPTDLFWGLTYDTLHVRYAVPVHPVQLYYMIFFLLLTFLLLIARKYTRRAGAVTLLGIVLAAIFTVSIENFRGDFGIPVYAMVIDFVILLLLFMSLGILALIEQKIAEKSVLIYSGAVVFFIISYVIIRNFLPFETFDIRFSQLLAVLALFATVVYVIVHRWRHPHL